MNFEDKIKNQIQLIKSWEGSKGKPYFKETMKILRRELYEMFPEKEMYLVVGDWVLEKQYNPVYKKEYIAIYSKASWDKRESYMNNKW